MTKIKLEAAARLKATVTEAGWFDALSDAAKKTYKKLHPGSKVGDGKSSKGTSPDRIKKAEELHKKHKDNYSKIRDSGGSDRSDAEWDKHDKALSRLEKSRDRLQRLKSGK